MRRLLLPALAAALALAACSSDGTSQPGGEAASPGDQASAVEVTQEDIAFCGTYEQLLTGGDDPLGQAESPQEAAEALRAEASAIDSVAGEAPEGIAEDIEVVAQVSTASLASLADLLEGEHGDVLLPMFKENRSPETIGDDAPPEQVAARDAAREWISAAEARYTPEVLEASQRVGGWYTAACQDGEGSTSGTAGTTTGDADADTGADGAGEADAGVESPPSG